MMQTNRRNFIKSSFVISGGLLLPSWLTSCSQGSDSDAYDIVIYGATSAGIVAAVQAARLGLKTIVVEPSGRIGGLTTGGLGATDLGNANAIGGISREFYHRLLVYYQNDSAWKQQEPWNLGDDDTAWYFEPHVAEQVYMEMLAEHNIPVMRHERLILNRKGVNKRGTRILSLITEKGHEYAGKYFIDATYEGDLMAMAGVSFHVGREANSVYDETLNGVQKVRTHYHIFPGFIDPYVEPGNPASGILPGVHDLDPGTDFEGDHRVQAYCFRMCLTDAPENMVPFERPQGYDEMEYELLFRNFEAGETRIPWLPRMMPNRKTDTNNRWGFSTNKIGINYGYPEGDYAKRESIIAEQEHYQKGLMWTLANHPRIPENIRNEVSKWGLAADEFTHNGHWPDQIYVREARRMVGDYVMTEHDCRRMIMAEKPIGLGSYTMDSHNVQRYITPMGCVQNEGNIEVGTGGPYIIPLGTILPKRNECDNLMVTCAVSSSHIAYGSIRMEPVFMILGQSAATAAAIALKNNTTLHDLPYQELAEQLLANNQRLNIDTEAFAPLPPDPSPPTQRLKISGEPVPERSCIVSR